jgi:PTH1 family peptidyl-tRNA hydrolase
VVVGLGNPGPEFAKSRHNAGADVVALLAERHGAGRLRRVRQHAAVGEVRIAGARVALVVPTTYMNDSGNAVAPLVRRFGIQGNLLRLVVVHDELDLPPGRLQVKIGGGTAGHNGLRSVQSHLHSAEFVRVRIGVGKPPSAAAGADHVLRRPSKRDAEAIAATIGRAADAVEVIATDGVEAAMNRFNGDGGTEPPVPPDPR